MNAKQENRLTMYKTYIAFCEKYPVIMAVNQKLWDYYLAFKAVVANIELSWQQQDLEIKGTAADKRTRRKLLAECCAETASYVIPYATDTSNKELEMEVDYSASVLFKLRDEHLLTRANNIKQIAAGLATDLLPYGLTPLILSELENCILLYGAKNEQPKVARGYRALMTDKISGLFSSANTLLRRKMQNLLWG